MSSCQLYSILCGKLVEQHDAELAASKLGLPASERTVARCSAQKRVFHRCIAIRKPYLSDAAKEKAIGLVPVRVLIGVKQSGQQVVWTD